LFSRAIMVRFRGCRVGEENRSWGVSLRKRGGQREERTVLVMERGERGRGKPPDPWAHLG